MTARLGWDDDDLSRKSDPALVYRYRRLQSWYREHMLAAEYGDGPDGMPVGSRLSLQAVANDRGLNFYPGLLPWVEKTVEEARTRHATLDENRLITNMLSSMPLCFNLIGPLHDKPEFAELLGRALDLPIATIQEATCEWAPQKQTALGDLTAFDGFVRFKSGDGAAGFLGIETKYTEPFSQREYDVERYRPFTEASDWFADGASDALWGKATNQLWRNVLLAATLSAKENYGEGWSVVFHLAEDERASEARDTLSTNLARREKVVWCTYERLMEMARDIRALQQWANWFHKRYLDLSPVEGS
jgi:hypothetical protein